MGFTIHHTELLLYKWALLSKIYMHLISIYFKLVETELFMYKWALLDKSLVSIIGMYVNNTFKDSQPYTSCS